MYGEYDSGIPLIFSGNAPGESPQGKLEIAVQTPGCFLSRLVAFYRKVSLAPDAPARN